MLRAFAVFVLTLIPAAPGAAAVDPTAPGPYGFERVLYEDGTELVGDAGATTPPGSTTAVPQAIKGELTLPAGAGPFPVVVLLHGNHGTCAVAGSEIIYPLPPCPTAEPAVAAVNSYLGYRELADNLASHGYLVASIDANSANGFGWVSTDGGAAVRAQIIALHLDRLAEWNGADGPDPVGGRLRGKVDLSRIGLMGHSRGGEAVSAFVPYSRERPETGVAAGPRYPGLRAVMALAPTDHADQQPAGVAWGTLLPLCDRDVADLSGARVYERVKGEPGVARVQYALAGANHNWFNSVWVDDEADALGGRDDAACAPDSPTSLRMTAEEQRRAGVALMGAFLRRYVGPEPALEPLVTGERGLPGSACPAQGDCGTRVQISHVAPHRRLLLAPGEGEKPQGSGFARLETCGPAGEDENGDAVTTCPAVPTRSVTTQLVLSWDGPATLRVPLAEPDASGFGALSVRAAAVFGDERNPAGSSQDFTVELVDVAGRRAGVAAAPFAHGALIPAPGGSARELVLGGVRLPLDAFSGVDLRRLQSVELRFSGRGTLQLADLALQEPGASSAPAGSGAPAPAPVVQAPATRSCSRTLHLRRAVSRRLVRARVHAGSKRLRVDRRLRVRVPAGVSRLRVTGRLRGGRRVRRVVRVRAC